MSETSQPTRHEHPDGVATYEFEDGSWTVSQHQTWLSGGYDSQETALRAVAFPDKVLYILGSSIYNIMGEDRPITMADLDRAEKPCRHEETSGECRECYPPGTGWSKPMKWSGRDDMATLCDGPTCNRLILNGEMVRRHLNGTYHEECAVCTPDTCQPIPSRSDDG